MLVHQSNGTLIECSGDARLFSSPGAFLTQKSNNRHNNRPFFIYLSHSVGQLCRNGTTLQKYRPSRKNTRTHSAVLLVEIGFKKIGTKTRQTPQENARYNGQLVAEFRATHEKKINTAKKLVWQTKRGRTQWVAEKKRADRRSSGVVAHGVSIVSLIPCLSGVSRRRCRYSLVALRTFIRSVSLF